MLPGDETEPAGPLVYPVRKVAFVLDVGKFFRPRHSSFLFPCQRYSSLPSLFSVLPVTFFHYTLLPLLFLIFGTLIPTSPYRTHHPGYETRLINKLAAGYGVPGTARYGYRPLLDTSHALLDAGITNKNSFAALSHKEERGKTHAAS